MDYILLKSKMAEQFILLLQYPQHKYVSHSLPSVPVLLKQHRQENKTHVTTGLSCIAIPCLTRSELKEGQYWVFEGQLMNRAMTMA